MRVPFHGLFCLSISLLIPIPRPANEPILVIWDAQTGVIINEVETQSFGEIAFHGDQRTVTFVPGPHFHTYDALDGTQLHRAEISSSQGSIPCVHWVHEGTLRLAASLKTGGDLVINIYELQLASTPPLRVLSSFPISYRSATSMPLQFSEFSFSPVSSHISFIVDELLVVLDVRDSKPLLETWKSSPSSPSPPGQFSPDGRFLAFKVSAHEILVWQNTPTGYVLWSSPKSRLAFQEFSWSPTSTSILCWGSRGIQLLHPDDRLSGPPSFNMFDPHPTDHLVAYSTDGTHIASTRQSSGGGITVLDRLSGTQQFICTRMRIQDIKIVDNTIFAVDTVTLVSWDLEGGGTMDSVHASGRPLTVCGTLPTPGGCLRLSPDCSQVAFSVGGTPSLYDVKTRNTVYWRVRHRAVGLRFSLDGRQLWAMGSLGIFFMGRLETAGDQSFAVMAEGDQKNGELLSSLSSPHGYYVSEYSRWIEDSGGCKLFWLPPSWRTAGSRDIRWDGKFLAFLDARHPEPVIFEFQP